MLSRAQKALFYTLASPLMRLNAGMYRVLRAPSSSAEARVHLGPGQKNYIDGWINVDANMFTGQCDLWADLRFPLPFKDNSIAAVYSHHMVEHLPNMGFHFRDVFRCLNSGGAYRVAGPNGDSAIKKFIEGDKDWFGDWPAKRESIGGRFENFVFCGGEHLTILTESFMRELLEDAGFVNIRIAIPSRQTFFPDSFNDCLGYEFEANFDAPYTLVLEAEKP